MRQTHKGASRKSSLFKVGIACFCSTLLFSCGENATSQEQLIKMTDEQHNEYSKDYDYASSGAKVIVKSTQAALEDLKAEGDDITLLNEKYIWTKEQWADVRRHQYPDSESEIADNLLYCIKTYLSGTDVLDRSDEIGIVISASNSDVFAAAKIPTGLPKPMVYGTYPNVADIDTQSGFNSIEDAIYYSVNGEIKK
ncbi:MAG: hypothetical protein IKQ39_08010 [Oscillospiraceae bacterium]|nr:hypothetical protein [Oscillospiraceae bacterium]